ncbi:MAG: site-specific phage recombinase/integrase protein [Pseudoduganella sp.]|jgi:integrase|nr:site-specific phage recombinase/integrase protein [Pseudoduganella sp.]
MPIRYDKRNRRWRYEFNKVIQGQRVRASKLLPEAWGRDEAQAFEQAETARLYGVASGAIKARILIQKAVDLYAYYRCPELKTGNEIIQELALIHGYFDGRYLDELADVAKEIIDTETSWSPATLKARLSYLRAACNYAKKKHGLGDRNELYELAMPTVRNARHHYAGRADMLKIARACTDKEGRALVRIAFYSGMRLGEVLSLGKGGQIHDDGFILDDTKNGERRFVPMHPRIRVLVRYLPFTWSRSWLEKHVRAAMNQAGFKHLHFHDLRHSTASEMVNNGVELYTVGGILGHKDKKTTERYAHLVRGTLADAIKKVG